MTTPETSPKSTPAKGKTTTFTLLRAIVHLRTWWREAVIEDVDQDSCIEGIRGESLFTSRYVFMICMSAGIAVLGLLLSSPAVVIGAMLLSPLMSPIIGAGFALATGDFLWLRRCGRALLLGSLIAILFCAAIVFLSPLQTVTSEIAARTRPNLFDLLVALFSALAGTYAMIRGRMGTIVGVAIATALMPPLAVVGFGLATFNWTVFGGSLMLFVTNLITIAITAALMARLYGFRTRLTEKQTRLQDVGIFVVFVILAIPLFLSLQTITFEARAAGQIRSTIEEAFVEEARIDQLDINFEADPLQVEASMLTPEFERKAEANVARRLERALGRPVAVEIDQFRVGTDPGAAEQAQLERAREEEQERASAEQVGNLTERLALVAGVPLTDVTLDRDNRRALADARALEGLGLEGYRTLERRAAADMEGWDVRLRPPALPLPSIPLDDEGALGSEGEEAASLVQWAASRTRLPVSLSGPDGAVTALAERMREAGIPVTIDDGRQTGQIVARWAGPQS
ncbi:DUF389 domain-containing protein [Parerythrobacter jejuensis]|uniref:DUF389 domain-containing protein n=1 Tax=Parerythrobacter jejuensis TaxID=795812 RepID=A0A845ASS6_9SPHN|nr:DUF389 domain-containing protein [Parerythrobacter jejuensis]MXP31172.1 DUF389 domain-containing protein [Parerythrobacter jejuensis]MXP33932.1 DUF389 domain-containing protein [Parerythrobacter jejuensis]